MVPMSVRSVVVLGLLGAQLAIRERNKRCYVIQNIYPDPEVCSWDPRFDQTTGRNSENVNGHGI